MPILPNLDLSQAHFDRVVAAFPGATGTEKTEAYRAWLINNLIDEVERSEIRRIEVAAEAEKQQEMDAVRASLPSRVEYPEGYLITPNFRGLYSLIRLSDNAELGSFSSRGEAANFAFRLEAYSP